MTKIARFVFETAFGPFVAWCCASLLLFAAHVMSPLLGKFGNAMSIMMLVVLALAALAGVIAFFISLNERKYGRAVVQFFLGIAGLLLFCMGLAAAGSEWIREVGYSLYALEDGRYHLFNAGENASWRKEWRIDARGETVEIMFKDRSGKHGDLWVKIPPGATSANSGISISRGGGRRAAQRFNQCQHGRRIR